MKTFTEYQSWTSTTAAYPGLDTGNREAISYCALGIAGEAGEVADKVKKILRGDKPFTEEVRMGVLREIGDVVWYAARLAKELGMSFEEVMQLNVEKIMARKAAGTIKGSGDQR